MKSNADSFVDKLRNRNAIKPTIGMVYSPSTLDDYERRDGRRFHADLENIGTGCKKVDLDFHEICTAFKANSEEDFAIYVKDLVKEKKLNGLIFPGDWYNAIEPNVNPSADRMIVEKALWNVARNMGLPLLGVCGGHQHVSFFAGAEMTNNVEKLTGINHNKHTPDELSHDIIIKEGTALYGNCIKNQLTFRVNSTHNQGVVNTENTVTALKKNNLEVSATDNTKKLVEAIESINGAPVTLTQFHPEYLNSDFDRKIMKSFITAASVYAAGKSGIAPDLLASSKKLTHVETVVKSYPSGFDAVNR
jgi:gamma-glutamyl-gamma-aminobutyrate hydrolase PuuD